MWLWLALFSAILLGVYDVAKKKALARNSVLWVLFSVSVLSTILLIPFFSLSDNPVDYLLLVPKAFFVSASWISGLKAMRTLPLTTISTIKASRPIFVVLLSILIFGERLNLWQWAGVALALSALFMLSRSSRSEGIYFSKNKGILMAGISVIMGVVSALYDKAAISSMGLAPFFVQSWCNLYITIILGAIVLFKALREAPGEREHFTWDPMLIAVAVLIVGADALYFYSISCEGAMLSVISLLRRFSVVVTFVLGAIAFKEGNVKSKAWILSILMAGLILLLYGSR